MPLLCPPGWAGSELRAWHQHGTGSGAPAWAHPTSHIPHPSSRCSPAPTCPPTPLRDPGVPQGSLCPLPRWARSQPCPSQRCHHQVQSAKVLLFLHPLKTLKTEQNKQKKGFPSSFANTLIQSPKSQQSPGHLLAGRVPCGQHGHRQDRPPVTIPDPP